MLSKEEGGRHTPFFKGYRPQFYFRTTDVTGVAQLPEGTEMVMPGDNVQLDGGADHADRHGQRVAVRDPRRRPYGGRRYRDRDHEVDGLGPVNGRLNNATRNYHFSMHRVQEPELSSTKNKKTTTERLEMKKFCRHCRKHQPHKEIK